MMKSKKLFVVLVCIVILSGCNMFKSENGDTSIPPDFGASDNFQERSIPMSLPDLSTEEGIREYLVGEWVFDKEYVSDVVCKMSIDEDLNVNLSFHNDYMNEPKGDYAGQIKFDRIYANPKEAPDLLSIELMDTDYPGGDFFFLHRTIYDGKRVMSWFFAGNGNCIFDMLGPDDFEYAPEEIMFEKVSGETSQLRPRKNDEFHAVFWGKGAEGQSLWIDDVRWTLPEQDDFASLYPRQMTLYENDAPESVLYSIAADQISDILGDDLFPGEVYFVQTDEHGNITHFINAEYKKYLEDGLYENIDPEIEDLIFDIIMNDIVEIQEYLDAGMTILFTGETTIIDGEECYDVVLGTNHEEHFVREIHYAVNIFTRQVYRLDVLNNRWKTVAVG